MDATLAGPVAGHMLDGRYRIESRIARGGMATVFLATDTRLDRTVAVKIMHRELAHDADFVRRFIGEAKSVARLSHPNVVAVFDQGSDGDYLYLAMEYVPGGTLRELLSERGRLGPDEALDIMVPVLAGLGAAHQAGFVHRDVKPENVLLTADRRIKVVDFGLARAIAQARQTKSGMVIGTAAYLAPEQISSAAADARTDVYAAGIMLFELVTGRQPYTGDTPLAVAHRHVEETVPMPSAIVPGLPPAVDAVVALATSRNPDLRPGDAGELLRAVFDARRRLPGGTAFTPDADRPTFQQGQPGHPGDPGQQAQQQGQQQGQPSRGPAAPYPGFAPGGTCTPPGAPPAAAPPPPAGPFPPAPLPPAPLPPGGARLGAQGSASPPGGARPGAQGGASPPGGTGPGAQGGPRPPAGGAYPPGGGRMPPGGAFIGAPPQAGTAPTRPAGPATFGAGAGYAGAGSNGDAARRGSRTDLLGPADGQHRTLIVSAGHGADSGIGGVGEPLPADRGLGRWLFSRRFAYLAGALAAVLIVSLIVWWQTAGRYTRVPDVVGLTTTTAATELRNVGFTVRIAAARTDNQIPKGQVSATVPRVGHQAPTGSRITLIPSAGPRMITVPNVTGKAVADAQHELRAAGLTPGPVQQQTSLTVPQGEVISTNPVAGTVWPQPKPVTIVASAGIGLPDFTGQPKQDAEQWLQQHQLQFQEQPASGSTQPQDAVDKQSPAANTPISQGEVVTLYISTGPPMVAIPNVTGLSVADAQNQLQQLGFQVSVSGFGNGQVLAYSPTGQAPQGATITLVTGFAP
jgi:serine/threonine-protein kinase